MVCAVCGQEGARIRRVTRSYGKGATLLIITAQTLHEIDRIKRHRHELASQRPVAVAAFA